ncbi:MAG: substrate-binding domain-containing protein [Thermodesulfobacteriota bacterium]
MAVIIGIYFTYPSASVGEVLIIANSNLPGDSISREDIKDIFIGNKTTWQNEQITFVIQDEGETHKEFLQNYVKRTPAQYSRFWKKQIFTGKGRKPRTFKNEEGLIEYVAGTDGAIGYISTDSVGKTGNVKVMKINGN